MPPERPLSPTSLHHVQVMETDDGKRFSAVPNQTLDERRALYKLYSENPKEFEKIKGKKATIKYQELTKNKIPRFCKFLRVVM